MIASPTLTSAAATTIIKKTNNCPSVPFDGTLAGLARNAELCNLEKATNSKFTALSINSMHIKMMMAFLRVNTPTIPIQNKAIETKM